MQSNEVFTVWLLLCLRLMLKHLLAILQIFIIIIISSFACPGCVNPVPLGQVKPENQALFIFYIPKQYCM